MIQVMEHEKCSVIWLSLLFSSTGIFKSPSFREMESSQKTFTCPWKCCQTPEGGCGSGEADSGDNKYFHKWREPLQATCTNVELSLQKPKRFLLPKENSLFQFMHTVSCAITEHHWEENVSNIIFSPPQVFVHTDKMSLSCLFSRKNSLSSHTLLVQQMLQIPSSSAQPFTALTPMRP